MNFITTTAESVAIEHLNHRRQQGWSFAQCRDEAYRCMDAMNLFAAHGCPMTWDDLTALFAEVFNMVSHQQAE